MAIASWLLIVRGTMCFHSLRLCLRFISWQIFMLQIAGSKKSRARKWERLGFYDFYYYVTSIYTIRYRCKTSLMHVVQHMRVCNKLQCIYNIYKQECHDERYQDVDVSLWLSKAYTRRCYWTLTYLFYCRQTQLLSETNLKFWGLCYLK